MSTSQNEEVCNPSSPNHPNQSSSDKETVACTVAGADTGGNLVPKTEVKPDINKLPVTSLTPKAPSGIVKIKQEGRAKMTAPSKGDTKQSETLMKMVMNKEASSVTKEARLLNRPLPTTVAQMDNLKTILNSVMKTSISQVLRHKIDKEEQSEKVRPSNSTDSEKHKEQAGTNESDGHPVGDQKDTEISKMDTNSPSAHPKSVKQVDSESEHERNVPILKDALDQSHKARKGSPHVAHKTLFSRNLPSIHKTEGLSSPGATRSPSKRMKKKPFRGATYDLYLSKKKHKKKHAKRDFFQLADPTGVLRDDESSLAGTETTGSFFDSEDSVSDYQTPSEISFQEEDTADMQNKESEKSGVSVSMLSDNNIETSESPIKEPTPLETIGSPHFCDESVVSIQKTDVDDTHVNVKREPQENAGAESKLSCDTDESVSKSRHSTHTSALKSLWQSTPIANKSSHSEGTIKDQSKTSAIDDTKEDSAVIPLEEAEAPQSGFSEYSDQNSETVKGDGDQSSLLHLSEDEDKTQKESAPPKLQPSVTDDETSISIASGVKIRQRCKRKHIEGAYDVDSLSITSSMSAASDHTELSKSKRVCRETPTLNGASQFSKIDIVYDHKLPPIVTCTCQEKALTAEEHRSFEGRISCQALDSIDDKLVGCCNTVTTHQLVRPSVKIPFTAMCEVHLWRLHHHHCCPGCGIFCTQGNFLECIVTSNGKRQVHLFHKQCEVLRESPTTPQCPHCGKESEFQSVNLELNLPSNTMFFLTQKPSVPRARMTLSRRRGENADVEDTPSVSYKIAETGRVLSSVGLPVGPDRTRLESLLVSLQSDRPLSLRNPIKNCYLPIKNGDVDKMLQILASGFDPNHKFEDSENETPLHVAAKNGHLLIVHLLVQAGAHVDQVEDHLYTPLMKAVESKHIPVINYLIKAGAQLDAKAEDGTSSLHLAARNGNDDICKVLLDTGRINVNILDDGGWTPLVWAAENKHEPVVKLLLQCGADANIRDTEENVALHWSAYSGSVNISQLFLDVGCDLTAVNEHGDTPLHIAARQDNYDCVILFLARGADIEAKNKENETPLLCCRAHGSETWMALSINHELKRLTAGRVYRTEKVLHKDISRGKEQNPISCVNDVDEGMPPSDFLYITENCETSAISIDRTITSLQSCRCDDYCTSQACTCSTISFKCWYDKEGRLLPEFNLLDPPMIFECNRACLCWKTCYNRVLQNGIVCRLQLFRTAAKGWGVRTLKDIPKGTFICEYVGEIITDSEADQREDDSYLFDLDNRDGETYCLDARYYGNVSRFINHLCEPNLVPVKVFVDHQDLSFPRIAFFSSRDISAYEELGFDYGEKFWVIKYKWFTCGCGSEKCKYSRETIQLTLENYYRRMKEEQGDEEVIVNGHGPQ